MKVFVLGSSHTGKTPMAEHVARALGVPHLRASAWARDRFPGPAGGDRQAFVDAITRFSIAELRRDPWISVDHLAAHHDLAGPCVIEGIRNPLDFVHLYDPRGDVTVWLDHGANPLVPTEFEGGLDVIAAYLDWLAAAGLSDATRLRYRFGALRRTDPGAAAGDTLDDAIDDAIARLTPRAAPAPPPAPTPSRVHAEIPPLRLSVRAEYLHGMDPARLGELAPCTAFAVSSYPGEAPTFQILLGDGAVFSYLPPTALLDPARRAAHPEVPELDLEDLVYVDCPAEAICVHRWPALDGRVLAWLKRRDLWLGGDYLFTVDWWTDNQLAHAILLDHGQVALLPHHKLKFGSGHGEGFAPYRKLRKVWRVGGGAP
jgi:hypothetical protein